MMSYHSDHSRLLQNHRRRRWAIRICLAVLIMLLVLTIIGMVMLSSSQMTPEEAEALLKQQLSADTTRAEVEHFLGKPFSVTVQNGSTKLVWHFIKQSFNLMDFFAYTTFCNDDGTIYNSSGIRWQVEGWSAWIMRWDMLKDRLGLK